MMVEFSRIKMSLFLILELQFTATELLSFTVRDGDEVTLPCKNVIDGQKNCGGTTWTFSHSRSSSLIELIELGQIGGGAKSKSDRLSVTANCSLVIKKVTVEDVGRYFCQQYKSGQQQGLDALVYLSLVNMNKQKDDDKVTLSCSVSSYERCKHKVKFLYAGQNLGKNHPNVQTQQSSCSESLKFQTAHFIYSSRYKLLKCEVTDGHTGKVQLFPFRLQSSGEDSIRATTKPTTTSEKIKTGTNTTASAINDASTELRGDTQTPTTKPTTTPEHSTAGTTTTGANEPSTNLQDMWWLFVVVAVVLVALLITVVVVIKRRRAKGNKSRMNGRVELTSNPAETRSAPETGQDTADPEDGVSYASINFTKKSNSKAKVRRKNDDDEGDAVTYTTVKASSTDPNNLYATVS